MIDERMGALAATAEKPVDASDKWLARLDPEKMREFLKTLPARWEGLEVQSRNEILKLLLDRVVVTCETLDEIKLAVYWATGREECLHIRRWNAGGKFVPWSESEDEVLRELSQRAPRAVILERLLGHRWSAIMRRAAELGFRRERKVRHTEHPSLRPL